MKVFVTGASGFIGQYLVLRLLEKGHSVKCLLRKQPQLENPTMKRVDFCIGDLSNGKSLKNALEDSEVVFHLAGSVFNQSWESLYQVNSISTKNIYQTLESTNVKRFIYLSSIAALGPSRNGCELNEGTSPHPVSMYGKSKLFGEKFLNEFRSRSNVETIVVRPPMVYGVGVNPRSRMIILIETLQKKTFRFIGNGRNHISLCYVKDLVNFLELLLSAKIETKKIEYFNVCDDEKMLMSELVANICHILNINIPRSNIPLPLARLIAAYYEVIKKFKYDPELLTQERVSEIVGDWNVSNSKAKKYGYRQTSSFKTVFSQMIK